MKAGTGAESEQPQRPNAFPEASVKRTVLALYFFAIAFPLAAPQVTFVAEQDGRASKLILHQNGRDMAAPRTGD